MGKWVTSYTIRAKASLCEALQAASLDMHRMPWQEGTFGFAFCPEEFIYWILCRCWWSTAYVLALFPESWPRQTLSLCQWSLLISEREKDGRVLHLPFALREWRTRDGEEGIDRGGRTFWEVRRAGPTECTKRSTEPSFTVMTSEVRWQLRCQTVDYHPQDQESRTLHDCDNEMCDLWTWKGIQCT